MTLTPTIANQAIAFEVMKAELGNTRTVPLNIDQALDDNEVLLKIDKFALTANNISYGVGGDALGYWRFFPTDIATEQANWGRLPVMGYAGNELTAGYCERGDKPNFKLLKSSSNKLISLYAEVSEWENNGISFLHNLSCENFIKCSKISLQFTSQSINIVIIYFK